MARVDEPDRLNRYIKNFGDHNEDFKALVLRFLFEYDNNVAKVAAITHVPERTVYDWLQDWNKKKSQDSIISAAWGEASAENSAKQNMTFSNKRSKNKRSGL